MSSDNTLLYAGAALVVGFALVAMWKRNTAKPVPANTTGTLGTNPVLNPAAPKTPGDFARYDRTLPTDTAQPRADMPAIDYSYNEVDFKLGIAP